MITLYEYNEHEFVTNGLGSLFEAVSCNVIEERNGSFELEMVYPINGRRYVDLTEKKERIILAKPSPKQNPQPFRIYDISKPINGTVTVKARHISYDLSGYIISPPYIKSRMLNSGSRYHGKLTTYQDNAYSSSSGTDYIERFGISFVKFLSCIMKLCTCGASNPDDGVSTYPYHFEIKIEGFNNNDDIYTDVKTLYLDTLINQINNEYYTTDSNGGIFTKLKSVKAFLGEEDNCLLGEFSGELKYDKFNITFMKKRGSDKGIIYRYGKNITDLTLEEDTSSTYSGVYPYWDGSFIYKKKSLYDDKSREIYHDLSESSNPNHSRIIRITDGLTDGVTDSVVSNKVLALDITSKIKHTFDHWTGDSEYSNKKTDFFNKMYSKTVNYIKKHKLGEPIRTINISFVELYKSNEYSNKELLETIELCDTVNVVHPELGIKYNVKCVSTDYDAKNDKYNGITLGTPKPKLSRVLRKKGRR